MRFIRRLVRRTLRSVFSSLPETIQAGVLHELLSAVPESWKFERGLPTMGGSLANLRKGGLSPQVVIDVGAYVGEWTRLAAAIFPSARFHMIEAQPEKRAILEPLVKQLYGRGSLTTALLGPECRERVTFHCLESGSSVLEECTTFERTQKVLSMRTLDSVVEEQNLQGPFLLKLDVQGYELEVLKGASRTLASTEAVLLETTLIEYNQGAPLFNEVVAFMAENGFVPYDFCGQFRRQSDGALFQTDVIFARTGSVLRAKRKFWNSEPG